MNKYYNKTIIVNGYKFDSIKEATRYKELLLLQKAGVITDLKTQVPFVLQESFKKNGKTHRKIEYIADFVYTENGKTVVEDCKGFRTEVYKIKKKLFEKKYEDLEILEV